jgi:hypothetical protein
MAHELMLRHLPFTKTSSEPPSSQTVSYLNKPICSLVQLLDPSIASPSVGPLVYALCLDLARSMISAAGVLAPNPLCKTPYPSRTIQVCMLSPVSSAACSPPASRFTYSITPQTHLKAATLCS